jgi:hypothetical protein
LAYIGSVPSKKVVINWPSCDHSEILQSHDYDDFAKKALAALGEQAKHR